MRVRPVVLAWSGGKDSSLALAALRVDPAVDVIAVITTITRDHDRISITYSTIASEKERRRGIEFS